MTSENEILGSQPEDPNRELTPEEIEVFQQAIAKEAEPFLEALSKASDMGDAQAFFASYKKLLELYTPTEISANGQIVPPWFIPRTDIQLILIHTHLALITKVCADAGVFRVAASNLKAKSASPILGADGRPA